MTDKHAFETLRCLAGCKGLKSPNTDYHISLKHFGNKDSISTKALYFSKSPFVAQVHHPFEDTKSKRTLLYRSAERKQAEITTGGTQKRKRKKHPTIAEIWCSGKLKYHKKSRQLRQHKEMEKLLSSFSYNHWCLSVFPSLLVVHIPRPVCSLFSHPVVQIWLTCHHPFPVSLFICRCFPRFNLYVLPACISIPPSRGREPALWLIIVIPP